jgi:hypothetical protein
MLISDSAVAKVMGEAVLTRDNWKRLQHMSREEMQRYLVAYYRTAFEDGANAVATIEVPWDRILEVISNVKGVGPALLQRIDEAVRGEFE